MPKNIMSSLSSLFQIGRCNFRDLVSIFYGFSDQAKQSGTNSGLWGFMNGKPNKNFPQVFFFCNTAHQKMSHIARSPFLGNLALNLGYKRYDERELPKALPTIHFLSISINNFKH